MVTDRSGRRWWGFGTPPLVFAMSLSFAEMKHLMNSLWCMPQEGKNVVWSWYDATAGFAWKRLNCNMLPKSTPLPLVCPMAKVLVMSTCKIHFIRSPGAIIAVVQTPAKNPEVRIWKYLSKKIIHHIVIYYYAYYAFREKWTCAICWWEEQTKNAPLERGQQSIICMNCMDGSITTLWIFRPIKASDKNSTAQPLPYFLMKKRLLLLSS